MNQTSLFRGLSAVPVALLLCSCASVTVKQIEKTAGTEPKAKPARIFVEPFAVENAKVKENRWRKNHGKLAPEVQTLLADYLVEELSKNIAPAVEIQPGKAPAQGGWVVTGEITRLAEGSRMLRMGIGAGFGGTKLETKVAVHALPATKPFLQFSTTGGSNAELGAATNPLPFSSAPTALFASKQGVTDDSARTARMITAEIADYMVKRGWKDAATTPKPKTGPPIQ